MSVKREVYEKLTQMGISFETAEHARVSGIAECALPEALLGGRMPRNLFLAPRNLSSFWLLIAHPSSAFRTSSVSAQAGVSRLAFAPEAELFRRLRARPGAVSPLGLLFDEMGETRLLVDKRLLSEPFLLFHPCENDASVKLSTADFLGAFLPAVGARPLFVNMEPIRKDTP